MESILLPSGDDDKLSLEEKSCSVSKRIDHLKTEIDQILECDHIDIVNINVEYENKIKESLELINGMILCQKYIEGEAIQDILNSTHELQKIKYDLDEVNFSLMILEQLVECDKQVELYNKLKDNDKWEESVTALSSLTHLLNNPISGLDRIDIFQKMKSNSVLCWERLLNDLSALWKPFLNWSDMSSNYTRVITIVIDKRIRKDHILKALIASKQIHIEMKPFCNFLLRSVLSRLIHHDARIELITGETDILNVTITENNKTIPDYQIVLANLKCIFEFLYKNLESDDNYLLKLIGSLISVDFSDILIKDCLVQTIPNNISELQDYGKVTSEVEHFQSYLTEIGVFEIENFSILQYANNVEIFANKISQHFLESARIILKKDLVNTMSVGTEVPTEENAIVPSDIYETSLDKNMERFSETFQVSPFLFPRCAISRSVQELIDLIVVMMEQASEASDVCSKRLYYTARNVIELYMAIVPLHFKSELGNMPQQIVLFHNNSMYLAHYLLTLGAKWQKNLLSKDREYMITFCDQIKELRDLATEKLLHFMRIQRQQIFDTIRSSDIYYIATKDVLGDNAEQSIRQCIRQLQILKTVWSGILPPDIYKRIISCLANVLVEELISKVTIQEDITAEVASQLSEIYNIVSKRLPQIYQRESDIRTNIPQWHKFNELILILKGSLADIDERWFDGTGPLALYFKPEEIKRLVRALFQNTAFRANILAKIK